MKYFGIFRFKLFNRGNKGEKRGKQTMTKIKVFGLLLVVLIFGVIFSLGTEVLTMPPNNVHVVVDHQYQEYYSPPCLNSNIDYESLIIFGEMELVTLEKARDLNFEPTSCTSETLYNPRSIFTSVILEDLLGLVDDPADRWNDDGSWNW